jgi:hypothetical protein
MFSGILELYKTDLCYVYSLFIALSIGKIGILVVKAGWLSKFIEEIRENILKPGYAKWKGCTEGVESKSTAVEMLVSILFKNRQL